MEEELKKLGNVPDTLLAKARRYDWLLRNLIYRGKRNTIEATVFLVPDDWNGVESAIDKTMGLNNVEPVLSGETVQG